MHGQARRIRGAAVNGIEGRLDEKQDKPGRESNGYGHGSEEHGGMHALAEMVPGALWIASVFAPCERRRNRQSRYIASRLNPVGHGLVIGTAAHAL
jgi:hypothetical protein